MSVEEVAGVLSEATGLSSATWRGSVIAVETSTCRELLLTVRGARGRSGVPFERVHRAPGSIPIPPSAEVRQREVHRGVPSALGRDVAQRFPSDCLEPIQIERIQEVTGLEREADVHLVRYALAGVNGAATIVGGVLLRPDPALDEAVSHWRRTRWMLPTLVGAEGLFVAMAYGFRHRWYLTSGREVALLVVVAFAAFVASAVGPWWVFSPRARTRGAALVATLALGATQLALVSGGDPSPATAALAMDQGDVAGGLAEASAAFEAGIEPATAGAMIDKVLLDQVASADEVGRAAELLGQDFRTEEGRRNATTMVVERIEGEVREAQALGDYTSTASKVALLGDEPSVADRLQPLLLGLDLAELAVAAGTLDGAAWTDAMARAESHGADADALGVARKGALSAIESKLAADLQQIRSTRRHLEERAGYCNAADRHLAFARIVGVAPSSDDIAKACRVVDRARGVARHRRRRRRSTRHSGGR